MDEEEAREKAELIMIWLTENTWELEFNHEDSAISDISAILLSEVL